MTVVLRLKRFSKVDEEFGADSQLTTLAANPEVGTKSITATDFTGVKT